ncbi:MAG: cytochrome c oxidase subunit II [Thermoleophilia bacterium]|nr:cytochrome c oxidase subunit II [Thermoleophilia bacterium]
MRRRRLIAVALLVGLALAVPQAGLAQYNGGIAPPDSATESGGEINDLYWIVIGVTSAIFLLVEGAIVWFVLRFRRRPGTPFEADAPQIHGNTRLELAWTVVPFLILVGILAITIVKVPSVEARADPGEQPLVVRVAGHQFYWEYTYPNGVVSVDTLRLPVERPVRLELVAEDVIHSWWVPELTGKRDAIPGTTNTLEFTAAKQGSFRGQCAELCGVQHAVMRTTVEVVAGAEFDAWLAAEADAQAAGTSELGRATWEGVCAKCHGLDGKGGYGPQIAGNSLLADPAGLAALLAAGRDNPQVDGYMPAVSGSWPGDGHQLEALVDFIAASPALAPASAGGQEG